LSAIALTKYDVAPVVPEIVAVASVADVATTLDKVGAAGAVRRVSIFDSYDVPEPPLVVIAVISYDVLFATPLKSIDDVLEFPWNLIEPLILAYMVYVYPIYCVV
jgi:hypothetical protein